MFLVKQVINKNWKTYVGFHLLVWQPLSVAPGTPKASSLWDEEKKSFQRTSKNIRTVYWIHSQSCNLDRIEWRLLCEEGRLFHPIMSFSSL